MPQQPTGFERMYPNISAWVASYGWIEIGDDGQRSSVVRAWDDGGLVWENNQDAATLDELLHALDSFLVEQMSQYG